MVKNVSLVIALAALITIWSCILNRLCEVPKGTILYKPGLFDMWKGTHDR
jgi:hypothetical protein